MIRAASLNGREAVERAYSYVSRSFPLTVYISDTVMSKSKEYKEIFAHFSFFIVPLLYRQETATDNSNFVN
jgi:hypothetical protein